MNRLLTTILLAMPLLALPLTAAPAGPSVFGINMNGNKGPDVLGVPMQIVMMLTALTLLPAILMSITPFLRITIVLHFLRQALGTQSAPSNQVLIGLSLFLSMLVMQPVAKEMYAKGWEPMAQGKMSQQDAWNQGSQPLKTFLMKFTREKDIALMLEISKEPSPKSPADLSLAVLASSYVLSELKAGFQIGAVLFFPFLIIDLIVASVTLSIGMVQLPPVMISAPFKILLFVLVDGWNLVVGSLLKSLA